MTHGPAATMGALLNSALLAISQKRRKVSLAIVHLVLGGEGEGEREVIGGDGGRGGREGTAAEGGGGL